MMHEMRLRDSAEGEKNCFRKIYPGHLKVRINYGCSGIKGLKNKPCSRGQALCLVIRTIQEFQDVMSC